MEIYLHYIGFNNIEFKEICLLVGYRNREHKVRHPIVIVCCCFEIVSHYVALAGLAFTL